MRSLFFLLLIWSFNENAMEQQPRLYRMIRDDQEHRLNIATTQEKFSFWRGDCFDCFKWSNYLLQSQSTAQRKHPLARRTETPCCGEGCDIAIKCTCSAIPLVTPHCCLCGATYVTLTVAEEQCCSTLGDTKLLVSILATLGCSVGKTLSNSSFTKNK